MFCAPTCAVVFAGEVLEFDVFKVCTAREFYLLAGVPIRRSYSEFVAKTSIRHW